VVLSQSLSLSRLFLARSYLRVRLQPRKSDPPSGKRAASTARGSSSSSSGGSGGGYAQATGASSARASASTLRGRAATSDDVGSGSGEPLPPKKHRHLIPAEKKGEPQRLRAPWWTDEPLFGSLSAIWFSFFFF
jgi:hypothetical protein